MKVGLKSLEGAEIGYANFCGFHPEFLYLKNTATDARHGMPVATVIGEMTLESISPPHQTIKLRNLSRRLYLSAEWSGKLVDRIRLRNILPRFAAYIFHRVHVL